MQLRSLALNQFKKFTTPTRLDGIEDGLNVVVGPNEMGKSTLLNALRAVLFEKYGSKAKPITALQNDRNQAGPVVELTFELCDGLYRITKRFIKKPYARLACPDGRTLEGDSAEYTLGSLLGFYEPGKTGAKPETLGMWSVLWVQQGQSLGPLDLPEVARSSVHSALESEVGVVLGGRRGRALPHAIEKQLGELITPATGRPRGNYRALLDHVESLHEDLEELRVRRQDLSQTMDDLEGAEETLLCLSTGNRDRADQRELEETRQRHSQLAELEARIDAASSELKLRTRDLEQAEQVLDGRQRLKDDIEKEERIFQEAGRRLAEVRELAMQYRSQVNKLRRREGELNVAVTKAEEEVSQQQRILGSVERQARIQKLEGRHEKALAAENRQYVAQQAASAILVTDEVIEAIRKAAKGLETVESRLAATATRKSFDMTHQGLLGIEVDGEPALDKTPTFQAVEPTTITIPNRGTITIEPGIKAPGKLIHQQRDKKMALRRALDGAVTKNVDDAEDQYGRRERLLRDAELARQEVELHAPATGELDLGPQPLGGYIDALRQVLAGEKDALGPQALPTRQDAEAALLDAREQADETRSGLSTARAGLSEPEEALGRLQIELATVKSRYDQSE